MKLLYLHDYQQNLNATRIDELKEQYEVITPLVSDADLKDEARMREVISELSADYLDDCFLATGEALGNQDFHPLLDIERVPRKEVVLDFDKQPLEIPGYLVGFVQKDELNAKAAPRYFCALRALQKFGQHADKQGAGYTGLIETAQAINKILDDADPVKSIDDKDSNVGKYDYLAIDIDLSPSLVPQPR